MTKVQRQAHQPRFEDGGRREEEETGSGQTCGAFYRQTVRELTTLNVKRKAHCLPCRAHFEKKRGMDKSQRQASNNTARVARRLQSAVSYSVSWEKGSGVNSGAAFGTRLKQTLMGVGTVSSHCDTSRKAIL